MMRANTTMTASTRSRIVSLKVLTAMAHDLVHAVTTRMKKSSSVAAPSSASGDRPLPDDPSLAHDRDARAQLVHVAEDVRVEEHRLAALVQALDDALDLDAADGVEPGHRLVEQHELRVVDERLGDADPLQHAFGVLAEMRVGRGEQADVAQQLLDAASRSCPRRGRTDGRRSRGTRGPRGSRRSTGSRAGSRRATSPGTPSSTMPELGRIRPKATLTVVVLPAPLGPSSPNTSLGSTTRSTPLRISTGLRRKPTWTVLRRPLMLTAVSVTRGSPSRHHEVVARREVPGQREMGPPEQRGVRVVAPRCRRAPCRASSTGSCGQLLTYSSPLPSTSAHLSATRPDTCRGGRRRSSRCPPRSCARPP